MRSSLLRYEAEGLAGLADAPRSGAPPKVTDADREKLLAVVRRRPHALNLPFSLWTGQRLADHLAEQTHRRLQVRHPWCREGILTAPTCEEGSAPDYPVLCATVAGASQHVRPRQRGDE